MLLEVILDDKLTKINEKLEILEVIKKENEDLKKR